MKNLFSIVFTAISLFGIKLCTYWLRVNRYDEENRHVVSFGILLGIGWAAIITLLERV